MAKKSTPVSPTPAEKTRVLPLLIAGAVGFFAALLILQNCPMSDSCPMYSEACPVTSSLMKIDAALQSGNLNAVKANAVKLSEQLEPTMPDLAKLADRLAASSSLPQATTALKALEKKMMADVSPASAK